MGLHRGAVAALEALYGDEPGPYLAELASQALAGNDPGEGLSYARRAGDRAVMQLAYEEAARLYGTALDALDNAGQDGKARCELLLALGEAEGERATRLQRRPSSRRPSWHSVSSCRTSSRGQPQATAGGSRGRA